MVKANLFIKKNKQLLLQSQYVVYGTVLLTTITRGAFNGWAVTCVPKLRSEDSPLAMNDLQLSWVVSSQSLGLMVSAIPVGFLTDKYSSRSIAIYTELLSVTAWILLYMVKYFHFWELILVSRFLSGVWIGVQSSVLPLYVSEMAEPRTRGIMNTAFQAFLRFGSLYALILGLFVPFEDLPLMYAGFAVMSLLLLPAFPESPLYLLRKNDVNSARESLRCMRPGKTDMELETELKDMEKYIQKRAGNTGKFTDVLATRHNRKILFIVVTFAALIKLSGASMSQSFLSIMLPELSSISTPVMVVIIEAIRTGCSFASTFVYDKTGPRLLIVAAASLSTPLMLVAGLWYYLAHSYSGSLKEGLYSWTPFVCFLLQGAINTIGILSVSGCVRAEYFPANNKGKFLAIINTTTAFLGFVVNQLYLTVANRYGFEINCWFRSVNYMALTIFSYWFLIDTKGKTLQEIQERLGGKKNEDLDGIRL